MAKYFYQKKKNALHFTTTDGKEIYEGDDVEIVNSACGQWSKYNITKEIYDEYKSHCKFFSTEQAAQDYILMNKPYCLSLQDVLDMRYDGRPLIFKDTLTFDKFKELFKSKLNQ